MKITNLIFLLSLLISISSCYKDKGNYDYDIAFEITIDSIQESYTSYALVDTLKIKPEIYPANSEYDYWWGVYQDQVQGYAPKLDTLYYTHDLEMPMTLAPGTYKLVFCAKEKTTGIAEIVESSLSVVTSLTRGWYVLRTQDGYTDFDLFTEKDKIENVIALNNDGKNLKGKAQAVAYTYSYKTWDEGNSRYSNTNAIFALTNEDMIVMRLNNGAIIHSFEDLFYEPPTAVSPQDVYASIDIFMVNDGKMYGLSGFTSNSGRFGAPIIGDYKLSSFRIYDGLYDPLLYDENSCSFCTASASGNELQLFDDKGAVDSTPLPPVNNMDANLLFMGPTSNYQAYALMKKKKGDTYLMLKLSTACSSPYKNPIQSCDTLRYDLGIIQADLWASNTANHIIYYAQGNKIYSCNIDADYQETDDPTILPAGEEITYMRHLTYTDYKAPQNNFNYLAAASYDGNNYKVYLFKLHAGRLQANPTILEGKGKVGALIYINGNNSTALK